MYQLPRPNFRFRPTDSYLGMLTTEPRTQNTTQFHALCGFAGPLTTNTAIQNVASSVKYHQWTEHLLLLISVCISHSVISQGLMVACCFVTDVVGTVVGVWAEVGRWCLASTELSQFFTLFKSTSAPLVSMLSLPSKFHYLYLILQMFTKVISLLCQSLHIIV